MEILKVINSKILCVLFPLAMLASCTIQETPRPLVLIVTGGHSYDTLNFNNLFLSNSEFTFDTVSQPRANHLIAGRKALKYNVIVFYDSWQEISDKEKAGYLELSEHGKGFLFLHHSLASYQYWDEFAGLRGGRYYRSDPPDSIKDMRYKHDLDLSVHVVDPENPVTLGMKDFTIHDEGYDNIIIEESVTPLLITSNPDCAGIIAWTNKYGNSKVVYLMGGHDSIAFENENYKKLIKNSLHYLATFDQMQEPK